MMFMVFLKIINDFNWNLSIGNLLCLVFDNKNHILREKCPYSELFSRIQTRITPNADTFYPVL